LALDLHIELARLDDDETDLVGIDFGHHWPHPVLSPLNPLLILCEGRSFATDQFLMRPVLGAERNRRHARPVARKQPKARREMGWPNLPEPAFDADH
jgi:hypothetical protein